SVYVGSDIAVRIVVVRKPNIDILDGMGDQDRAFAHYRKANALEGVTYDPGARERQVDSLIRVMNPETLDAIPKGSESDVPVFIVGMPRSGTALVERIIGAHPRGAGAGPLPHISLSAGRIGRYNKAGVPYPECVKLLIRRDVQEISSAYLVRLLTGRERARCITDRMWLNFEHLGFIEILFPKARIIHCRRDPMDTGLSCYGNRLDGVTAPFATGLSQIGHYYGQYRRLMDHWSARSGLSILDVDYEALATAPEEQARGIMEFLELPWEPDCLALCEPPPYADSVGRAKAWAPHLKSLARALAAAGYPPRP
ncbi:MAG: sulfotransferase, partial [Gammaproteobacteria bacterium]